MRPGLQRRGRYNARMGRRWAHLSLIHIWPNLGGQSQRASTPPPPAPRRIVPLPRQEPRIVVAPPPSTPAIAAKPPSGPVVAKPPAPGMEARPPAVAPGTAKPVVAGAEVRPSAAHSGVVAAPPVQSRPQVASPPAAPEFAPAPGSSLGSQSLASLTVDPVGQTPDMAAQAPPPPPAARRVIMPQTGPRPVSYTHLCSCATRTSIAP